MKFTIFFEDTQQVLEVKVSYVKRENTIHCIGEMVYNNKDMGACSGIGFSYSEAYSNMLDSLPKTLKHEKV